MYCSGVGEEDHAAVHTCQIGKASDWVQWVGLVALSFFVAVGIVGLLKSYGVIPLDSSSWFVKVIDYMGNTPGHCGLWVPTIAAAIGGIGLIFLINRSSSLKKENLEEPPKVPEPPKEATNSLQEIAKPEKEVSNPLLDLMQIHQGNKKNVGGKSFLSFTLYLEIDPATFVLHKNHLVEAIDKACDLITQQIGLGCIFKFDLMISEDLSPDKKEELITEIKGVLNCRKLYGYDAKYCLQPAQSCFGFTDYHKDNLDGHNLMLQGNADSILKDVDPEWDSDKASSEFSNAFNKVPVTTLKIGLDTVSSPYKNLNQVLKGFAQEG